jgi:thiamine-monophosphate kinase
MPTESEFLAWLYAQQSAAPGVPVGIGDDLAVLKWGGSSDLLLVGIDQVLDGVHFDSKIHSPRDIGRKAINRNISDCAAMASLPVAAVASAAMPRGSSIEFAKDLYLGMKSAADAFDCKIVGGDTSAWDGKLALTVAIIGKSDGIQPITRTGAKVGDGVFVSGPLGGSLASGRHLTFTPRVRLAREIASTGTITSMIDVSDGLSRDLRQICDASHVSAIINAANIPIHVDAQNLEAALNDGEDHELLFTASIDFDHAGCTRIGSIIANESSQPMVLIEQDGRRVELLDRGWMPRW